MRVHRRLPLAAAIVLAAPLALLAHDGPPFPILSDHIAGPYLLSVWTDPDTTDDGSAGGQFWVQVRPAAKGRDLPRETRATVTIRAVDRQSAERSAQGAPVRGDVTNQFAALTMDHEGRFAVRVTLEGPLGTATADATVDATYDTRPAPALLVLYLVPFVLVGVLWARLLARRRTLTRQPESSSRSHA